MRPITWIVLGALTVTAACASQKPLIEEEVDEDEESSALETPDAAELTRVAAEEGFEVRMPGPPPEPIRNKVTIPAGDVATAAWTCQVDGVIYSLSTADYPEKIVASRPAEAFLNEAEEGLRNQLKGQVTRRELITLDGYPGRDFTVNSPSGEVRARNFVVGPRLYTLLVLYNPSIGAPHIEEFLTSLQLVNPPPPIPVKQRTSGPEAGTTPTP